MKESPSKEDPLVFDRKSASSKKKTVQVSVSSDEDDDFLEEEPVKKSKVEISMNIHF